MNGLERNGPRLTMPPGGKVDGNQEKAMNPSANLRRAMWPLVALLVGTAAPQPARAADEADFRTQVAPILEQNCLRCHGKKSQRGGLSLATAARAT